MTPQPFHGHKINLLAVLGLFTDWFERFPKLSYISTGQILSITAIIGNTLNLVERGAILLFQTKADFILHKEN